MLNREGGLFHDGDQSGFLGTQLTERIGDLPLVENADRREGIPTDALNRCLPSRSNFEALPIGQPSRAPKASFGSVSHQLFPQSGMHPDYVSIARVHHYHTSQSLPEDPVIGSP